MLFPIGRREKLHFKLRHYSYRILLINYGVSLPANWAHFFELICPDIPDNFSDIDVALKFTLIKSSNFLEARTSDV